MTLSDFALLFLQFATVSNSVPRIVEASPLRLFGTTPPVTTEDVFAVLADELAEA